MILLGVRPNGCLNEYSVKLGHYRRSHDVRCHRGLLTTSARRSRAPRVKSSGALSFIVERKRLPAAYGSAMTETAKPIPRDLAEAFCAAVVCYRNGDFGSPEPTVRFLGQTEPISTICAMVEPFKNDQIPKDILARLSSYMRLGDENAKNDLAGNQSYSMAGDCLLQLIQRRVTEYVRRQAWRESLK
jgi:hypothetical protein